MFQGRNIGDGNLQTGDVEVETVCPLVTPVDWDIVVELTRKQAAERGHSPCWDCVNAMSGTCGECQNYSHYQPET